MSPLIINGKNITKLLEEQYKKATHGWISLIQPPMDSAMDINAETIKVLQALGYEGIYVSLASDYPELSGLFTRKKVNMKKMFFVDGISNMYGIAKVDSPHVGYVSGPLALDEITESVTSRVQKMKKGTKMFVFLDSITTVLLYNSLERTKHFSKFLMTALKEKGAVSIVVSLSKGAANEALIKEITRMADTVINLQ